MSVEILPLAASGALGAIFGSTMTGAWFAKQAAQHRAEFLCELADDMHAAFDATDTLLTNMDLPKDIRIALVRLLAAHADPELGETVANTFLRAPSLPKDDDDSPNPLAVAMNDLFASNRHLARTVHNTIVTLMIALMVVHKGEKMKIEKVQTQASRDPETLLNKLFQSFGSRGPRSEPRNLQHA